MTPERAQEIVCRGIVRSDYIKHMTDEEVIAVRKVWHTMPGYTCFFDALMKIARARQRREGFHDQRRTGNGT
jgi:hypothetical protein